MTGGSPRDDRDPTDGLPDDLASVLRDQSVIVPQDAAVFEQIAKWQNAPSNTAAGAGGACGKHGVYVGFGCPTCRRTKTLAALRQEVWEAHQFLSFDEIRELVESVLREIESDEP